MRVIFLLLTFSIFSVFLHAQSRQISGTVTDSEEPVFGASVFNQGSGKGVTTDTSGAFQLDASTGDQIEVSFLGYQTHFFTVGERSVYEIRLSSSVLGLDEVVVTALGLERASKDLGYAIQQIDGAAVNQVKSVNFLDNLSGKIAGVTINQGATGVGSTSSISIRGEASFTNNNPLFVVDGIPINNNTIFNFTNEAAAGFQEVDFGNGAMEVNPDDVASVTVLKGPGAAALYGTRASNGVILIKTMDGSERKGLGISINSTTFVDRAFRLPQFQNQFGQGNSGQFEFVDGLGGGINDNITYSYGPQLDAGILIPQYDSPVSLPDGRLVRGGDVAVHGGLPITPTPFVSNPDNLKDFYETGITTINNIAFSGGYQKGNYRFSFTDLRSESIIPGVDMDRKTAAVRTSFRPTERLTLSTTINYVNAQSDNRPGSGYGSENINYSLVAWLGRQTNLEPLKSYWQPGLENVQQYSYNYTFFDNPYFILFENRNAFNRDRVFGNIVATYDFSEKISLSLRSGMDYSDEQRQFRRAFSSNRFRNGGYAEHDVRFREINTDFLFNYQDAFGAWKLDLSLGGNRMDQWAVTSQTQATSLAQPGIFKLSNAAAPLEIFEQSARKRINSFYGVAKLGYKDFLFVDLTGRNDWSSALATPVSTDNTSFFYPSISSSLVLSKVLNLPESISFAKIRASWAQVGNDTNPFQTAGVFRAQTPFNSQPTFSDQPFIPNSSLKPEQTSSVEVGADVRFFDDRLALDVTYYNALTGNQILSLPIAISSGYNEQVVNGGAVRSQGVEVLLSLMPVRTPKFQWNALFNFSTNRAIVESLPEGTERLTLAFTRVYDNTNQTVWYQVREGDQIGDMWGTGYLRNENGDFVISENGGFIVDNTLKKLGNYNPDFILGFSNHFQIKDLHLGFVFDWRQGGRLVSRTQALAGVAGQLLETVNRPESGIIAPGVVNSGTAENPLYVPNTKAIPAETYYRQFYDRNHEENNTYDASYLKLREVNIGYTFSKTALQSSFLKGLESLRISLLGRNLFAISDIPHFDPEQIAVQGQTVLRGVEDMSYATTRSFGLSIGLGF